jgi:hypothetical protein
MLNLNVKPKYLNRKFWLSTDGIGIIQTGDISVSNGEVSGVGSWTIKNRLTQLNGVIKSIASTGRVYLRKNDHTGLAHRASYVLLEVTSSDVVLDLENNVYKIQVVGKQL